jgi:hypothetical protein
VLLAFFFITLSLLPVGSAGRDDADDFIFLVLKLNRVCHQQQKHPFDQPKRLPAALAGFEDMQGDLETDAVLTLVGPGFGCIPLEPDHTRH